MAFQLTNNAQQDCGVADVRSILSRSNQHLESDCLQVIAKHCAGHFLAHLHFPRSIQHARGLFLNILQCW